jgi:hypothetical protein
MNLFMNDPRSPEKCAALGLQCDACVRGTAHEVRKAISTRMALPPISKGAAERLFPIIYPELGCQRMKAKFVSALRVQERPLTKEAAA